jgi:nitroreductase
MNVQLTPWKGKPMNDKQNAAPQIRGVGQLRQILNIAPSLLLRISEEDAAVKPEPDKWSSKEELGHLIDSAVNNHRRLVLGQIEVNPALPSYDGNRWVKVHEYQAHLWSDLIRSWEFFNKWLLDFAERVPQSGWSLTISVGASQGLTLEFIINDYVRHLLEHLAHIGAAIDLSSDEAGIAYPEKPALVEHLLPDLLARRWSPVAFEESRRVEHRKIMSLLEAARWAPSCFNEQPWRYLVFDGSDPEALQSARACLVDGNAWARSAPLLLLSVAHEDFTASGQPNRHGEHDTGMASENLVIEAVELGLVAHQMAGYDADRARESFHIPARFTPMAMIAVGYPYRGHIEVLPEKIKARETRVRSRKLIGEFAFSGIWDNPYRS